MKAIPAASVTLPARDAAPKGDAFSLIPVFRAAQIISTAVQQLPLEYRKETGKKVNRAPDFVRNPDPALSRSEWLMQCVLSLVANGNLFLRIYRDPTGSVLALKVLPPLAVTVYEDPKTLQVFYGYKGEKFTAWDIKHVKFLSFPGELRGRGAIQAAMTEVDGAQDLRDYAGNWFRSTGAPSGILTADKATTAEYSKQIKDAWNKAQDDPDNPSRIRVLGGGFSYTPLFLDPKTAQWLEVRQFTVTEFARLFGIPSSLMLVSLEGNSLTYSNAEQEKIDFIKYTVSGYLRPLEEALTSLAPAGGVVRFNFDAILRSDTASRYAAHATALSAGFMTVNEVRAIEDLPPLKETPNEKPEREPSGETYPDPVSG